MRTIHNILGLGIAALMAWACQTEPLNDPVTNHVEVTFNAGFAGLDGTKTVVHEDGTSIWWSPQDSINVFYGSLSSSKFIATNTQPAAFTTFTGTLNTVTGSIEAGNARDIWAVYPYSPENSCDGSSVSLTVPVEQIAMAGTFAPGTFPSVATAKGYDLAFYNICGGIVFSVVNEGIRSIELKGNNGEDLAGKVKVAFDAEGYPAVKEVVSGQKSITLSAPEGENFIPGQKYFITVLPGVLENGCSLVFHKPYAENTLEQTESTTINRSLFKMAMEADQGMAFVDTVIFNVSPKEFYLTNAAQDIEIEVQKNVQYAITIDEACKSWITQKGTKALSSEKVTFSIATNDSYDNREGKITFKQTDGDLVQTVTVKQSKTNGLFITTPEYSISNDKHTLSVEVQANVVFDVESKVDWIHYVETKALTTSTITLTIDANDTYDSRTGKVLVKQQNGTLSGEIVVNQAEKYGLFVSPEEISITKDKQTVDVEVKYNVEYEIIIPDAAKDWISVSTNPGTKGLTTGTVVFDIAENTQYTPREAALAFKQKDGDLTGTVKITQAQTDYINIKESSYVVPAEESVLTVEIESNVDSYEYSLPESANEWLTLSEKTATTLIFKTSLNFSRNERSGQLTVSYQDLEAKCTITQSAAQFTDLSEKESANCYIIPKAGFYSFNASVIGNGAVGIIPNAGFHTSDESISPQSVSLLWSDNVLLNPQIKYEDGNVLLYLNDTKGNFVIAAYAGDDSNKTIIWSWHLWCTSLPVEERYVNRAKKEFYVLDRNLGATSNSSEDFESSCGLLYQWGRKDPFPRNNELFNGTVSSIGKEATSGGKGTLKSVIQYPALFLVGSDATENDWNFAENRNKYLWGNPDGGMRFKTVNGKEVPYFIDYKAEKTIYDPCPAGYMVAPLDVWSAFSESEEGEWIDGDYSVFTKGTYGGWQYGYFFYINENDYSWYPAGGYFDTAYESLSQSLNMTNKSGAQYWSSATRDGLPSQATLLYVREGDAYPSYGGGWFNRRNHAFSIRCVREK